MYTVYVSLSESLCALVRWAHCPSPISSLKLPFFMKLHGLRERRTQWRRVIRGWTKRRWIKREKRKGTALGYINPKKAALLHLKNKSSTFNTTCWLTPTTIITHTTIYSSIYPGWCFNSGQFLGRKAIQLTLEILQNISSSDYDKRHQNRLQQIAFV